MIPFNNSYAKLPERFFARTKPAQVPSPALIKVNNELAEELGMDTTWLKSDAGLAVLSGNTIAPGSEPISLAYAGHQFGGWSPQLGDGRAVLLGEVINDAGKQQDIQLKGSGPTTFSRRGDGKSPLGPVIREYLMSEAMHALGVPTTRALAAVTTGEKVSRETPLDGAIFTRVASSHIRVGTFQYFAARQDTDALSILVGYALKRHYPSALNSDNPALTLLEHVIASQASLTAQWMSLGFIHGVMNTDNMTISGETIDYGPCAFMDDFHPKRVFSYIDQQSRYSWENQASITHWNLYRLAEALIPLIDKDSEHALTLAEQKLDSFSELFSKQYHKQFTRKLGIVESSPTTFIQDSLAMLAEQQVDFTLFFRQLTLHAENNHTDSLSSLFIDPEVSHLWLSSWRQYYRPELAPQMRKANPIVIPRNHLVERAIEKAYLGDFSTFHELHNAWKTPYDETHSQCAYLEKAPTPSEVVTQTFCGT